ncbi:transmembrane protein 164-like [Anoplophora glabripennis]|uniref:transmembrane protein 164-like n=1 Tax=Anoplophora glabripennis TaxID=217634 RepID=UPI0008754869|nr:transmembrane protein 164-like [Anoplophora glabripennis]
MSTSKIYLLAASPSKVVTAVFRFHLNLLNGPLLAYLFPETDTRILPLESAIYWIQHGMMFVVPYYLLRLGGVYNVEEFSDYTWSAISYSINLIYHFVVLQGVALPTQVNLNHMLCPAVLDPFDGQMYRICAVVHQAFLCPVLCKLFCAVSAFFLTKFRPTKVKTTLCCEVSAPSNNGDTLDVTHQHEE